MITLTKFNIGQQIKHKLLGFSGVIIDIDPKYALNNSINKKFKNYKNFQKKPWYHVITEDDNGNPIYTYLAEDQIFWQNSEEYLKNNSLYKLSKLIKKQIKKNKIY